MKSTVRSLDLAIEPRVEKGTSAVRRLRKQGLIPAVLYSEGKEAISITLNSHQFLSTTKGAGTTQLYDLKSSETSLNGLVGLIKDSNVNPLNDHVLHVDIYEVHKGHKLTMTVPVHLEGVCPSVKNKTAVLYQTLYEVEVVCLPKAIPDMLVVDINALEEGGSLHVRDMVLPEDVELKTDKDLSIVSAVVHKEEVAEEESVESVESVDVASPASDDE